MRRFSFDSKRASSCRLEILPYRAWPDAACPAAFVADVVEEPAGLLEAPAPAEPAEPRLALPAADVRVLRPAARNGLVVDEDAGSFRLVPILAIGFLPVPALDEGAAAFFAVDPPASARMLSSLFSRLRERLRGF